MKFSRRSWALASGAALLAFGAPALAQGEAWPARPIRLLVTGAAGGANDQVARVLAQQLQAALKQPVVVDPIGGANGMIATQTVANAAPDGYTLLMTHGALVQNEVLRPKRSYRLDQLQPVGMVATYPIGFAVRTAGGIDSLARWIQAAKADPQKFDYASYGTGSSGHVMGEILKQATGLDIPHVAYKGSAPAAADLVAGHVSAAFGAMSDLASHVAGGKIKVVAVTGDTRNERYPEVPTFAEQGFPQLSLGAFTGVLAPAGVPAPILARLSAELQKAVRSPEMREKLQAIGYTPTTMAPAEFGAYLQKDIQRWTQAVQTHKISLE